MLSIMDDLPRFQLCPKSIHYSHACLSCFDLVPKMNAVSLLQSKTSPTSTTFKEMLIIMKCAKVSSFSRGIHYIGSHNDQPFGISKGEITCGQYFKPKYIYRHSMDKIKSLEWHLLSCSVWWINGFVEIMNKKAVTRLLKYKNRVNIKIGRVDKLAL